MTSVRKVPKSVFYHHYKRSGTATAVSTGKTKKKLNKNETNTLKHTHTNSYKVSLSELMMMLAVMLRCMRERAARVDREPESRAAQAN